MYYDWEKILQNKNNKELYEIYSGNSLLPNETVKYARQELERRNFNFEDMEANKAAWEISRLIEEEDYARLEITGRRTKRISVKILFIIITGIFCVYYILIKFSEYDFPLGLAILYSGLVTALILLNNFQASKQKLTQEKRLEKIKQLKEKLDKENLLYKDNTILDEIKRHRIEEVKGIKTIKYIMIGIYSIMIITLILFRVLK